MLARYKIYRGKRPEDDPLPQGTRMDTRKHTRHVLRPETSMVERFLADGSEAAWRRFRDDYLKRLERRFETDRGPFDDLARRATDGDVFLGCNCPTKANPDVTRCHTVLALGFMKRKYRSLPIALPSVRAGVRGGGRRR